MSIQTLLDEIPPDLVSCRPSDRLQLAVAAMVENNLNGVVVVHADDTLAGILTDHDVMRAVYEGKGDLGETPVSAWMTDKVITCSIETPVTESLKLLGRYRIRHIVVTEGSRPLALVGIRHILTRIHEHDELEISVLRDMAIAARASHAA